MRLVEFEWVKILLKENSQELLGALVWSVCSLVLYCFSIAPTVQGFDSAELTVGAYDLGFVHPPGYPLYLLIGHLFSKSSIGDVGFRLNLMSAVFACLAVFLLYKLIYRQTRNFWAATVATLLLATTPAFWSQAVRAEVYTLHIFLMVGALYFWFDALETKSIPSYFICYTLLGLGLGNHPTTILLWISILICTLWMGKRMWKISILANIFALIVASILYLYFPIRSAADLQIDYIRPYFTVDPGTFEGLWWMVSGQAFRCLLYPFSSPASWVSEASWLVNFLLLGMLGFGLILAVWGWSLLKKSHSLWNRLLAIYLLANMAMFLLYSAVDKEVMFIPIYVVLTIWAASGFIGLVRWVGSIRKNIPLAKLHTLVGIGCSLAIVTGVILDWPLVNLRSERKTYTFAAQVLENLPPDTTIVNHWVTASVFDYLKIVEGKRLDVESFNVDFYFLSIQKNCLPITTEELSDAGWFDWIALKSSQNQMCFMEPLHDIPEGYTWHQQGACWQLGIQRESEL